MANVEPKPARSFRSLDWLYDPKTRGLIFQVTLVVVLLIVGYEIVSNTAENLRKQNLASGFGFLDKTSGFDISQRLVEYKSTSSYGRAFVIGLLNTLLVSGLGIMLATVLGFAVGLGRLSSNWITARLSTTYVEIVRNVPLLLQLFVWYVGVLRTLPMPQEALGIGAGAYLDARGAHLPSLVTGSGVGWSMIAALLCGIATALVLARWARRRQEQTGETFPTLAAGAGVVVVPPLLVLVVFGLPLHVDYPTLGRFNYEGGLTIEPEFLALLAGLTFYTAAFIAEIVRSGIEAVPRGQKEAARALGLRPWQVQRLVVIPQAMRVIIPPLTNQYLNLTKNSSLAVAIGYPDLVSVFAGTVLNQTNQAVEVILITMGVYLAISLLTALAMNWFNARMALVER
ncbi:MAG TPA: amino acid ABC transporter permease [Hyphomicrobium sp.]|jgi:general L-amino acid transport system permease protein